jgi:photoactive yellow protein
MSMLQTQPGAAPSNAGTFVPSELFGMLGSLSRADADACDFGVIKLDDSGRIELYNKYQSELGGVPVPTAEGKVFFTQIAPCTNNALFFGTFKKGVAAGSMNVTFNYTFTFKMKPTNVKVHMYRDPNSNTNWVFIGKV